VTVVAVVVVHGRNVGQPLAFDDFLWLDDHPSGLGDVLRTLPPRWAPASTGQCSTSGST